jgi:hypothetical protein
MQAVGLNASAELQGRLLLHVGKDAFPTDLEPTVWPHVSHVVCVRPNLCHGYHVPLKQRIEGDVKLVDRGPDLIVLSHYYEFRFSAPHTCDAC